MALFGWMLGCLVAIWLIGILLTVPLFIAGYMRLWGQRPWLVSILSGVAVLAFVTFVFELLLGTQLYRGLLLGALS